MASSTMLPSVVGTGRPRDEAGLGEGRRRLRARLQVSDRTVRRDIDRLRELGYHIHTAMGPDGGYRLGAGSELPPLMFDDDQTVAAAIALQTAPAAGVRIEEGALRALATIRQVMPSRLRHRLDALDVTAITGRAGSGTPARVSADVLVSLPHGPRPRGAALRLRLQRRPSLAPHPHRPALAPRAVPGGDLHDHRCSLEIGSWSWASLGVTGTPPLSSVRPQLDPFLIEHVFVNSRPCGKVDVRPRASGPPAQMVRLPGCDGTSCEGK